MATQTYGSNGTQYEAITLALSDLRAGQQADSTRLAQLFEDRAHDLVARTYALTTLERATSMQQNLIALAETQMRESGNMMQQVTDAQARLAAQAERLDAHLTETSALIVRQAQDIHNLIHSRSWRMTAPIRAIGRVAPQLAGAARSSRVKVGALMRRGVQATLRRALLRRIVLLAMAMVPGLRERLRDRLYPDASAAAVRQREEAALAAAAPPFSGTGDPNYPHSQRDMPVKLAQIYEELKQAQQRRNK
jgi:hypothetical protein